MDAAFDFVKHTVTNVCYAFDDTKDRSSGKQEVQTEFKLDQHDTDNLRYRLTINIIYDHNPKISFTVFGYFVWKGEYIPGDTEMSVKIHGTSILYPFARSILSQLSILNGGEAVILNTINVYDLYAKKETAPADVP